MRNRVAIAFLILFSILSFVPKALRAQEASDSDRKIVTKVMPQYPAFLRNLSIEGVVRADVLVGPEGKVKSLEVKGGHPVLVQSAETALRQWKWEPASHESHVRVELRFKP